MLREWDGRIGVEGPRLPDYQRAWAERYLGQRDQGFIQRLRRTRVELERQGFRPNDVALVVHPAEYDEMRRMLYERDFYQYRDGDVNRFEGWPVAVVRQR